MWDYDKLFAEGNIVGLKRLNNGNIYTHIIRKYDSSYWSEYKNKDLSNRTFIEEGDWCGIFFEIQYIIRLDEYGNVIEKLFDREKDMPKPMPELESGMFITVFWNDGSRTGVNLGYVDKENNHIIYLSGGYDNLNTNWNKNYRIVEVYRKNTRGFRYCTEQNLIWHEPNYVHKDFNIGKE